MENELKRESNMQKMHIANLKFGKLEKLRFAERKNIYVKNK